MSANVCQSCQKNMDELAKRREARRRKILENSANRLQKITGVEQKSSLNNSYINNYSNESEEVTYHFDHNLVNHGTQEQQPLFNDVTTRQQLPLKDLPQEQNIRVDVEQKNKFPKRLSLILGLAIVYNLLQNSVVYNVSFETIFVPLISYEIIDFVFLNRAQLLGETKQNLLLTLLVPKLQNPFIKFTLVLTQIMSGILQDVMVYFFVFVSTQIVKQWLWTTSS